MKRCPQCNRTFTNDAQKFCTQDGVSLIDDAAPSPSQAPPPSIQSDTIRIQAPTPEPEWDDETTKQISRDIKPEASGQFDPFKTLVSKPQETANKIPVDTGDLKSAPTTPPVAPPPTTALNSSSSSDMMKTMMSYSPPPPSQPLPQPPVQTSAPLPQPQPPPLPMRGSAELPQVAQAPKKKSKLPLILGILVVLFFLALAGAAAGYFLVLRPMLEARRVTPEASPTPASTPVATPEKKNEVKEPPPYSPPPNAVQFVNSVENLEGRLKDHYVNFSFYYPQSWQKDPSAGHSSSNFAKVERRLPPDFTQENFAVGSYDSAGSPEGDRAIFPEVAKKLSAQFQKNFDPYTKVFEGPTRVGVYDGYEFRFESFSPNTEKGDIKIWGRVIFLPPVDGSKNGVTLLMLATSLAPELSSVDDVGVKGQLPMMLESFRFGK